MNNFFNIFNFKQNEINSDKHKRLKEVFINYLIKKKLDNHYDIKCVKFAPTNDHIIYLLRAYEWYNDTRPPEYKFYKHPEFPINWEKQIDQGEFIYAFLYSITFLGIYNILAITKYKKLKFRESNFLIFSLLITAFYSIEKSDYGLFKFLAKKEIDITQYKSIRFKRCEIIKELLYYNIKI